MKTIKIHNPEGYKTYKNGDVGYQFKVKEFEIRKETEKAIMLSRLIAYKNKEYTCWLPKSAFEFFDEDGKIDESEAFVKDFIYDDSYKSWFLTAN